MTISHKHDWISAIEKFLGFGETIAILILGGITTIVRVETVLCLL
jgi:hypothetical protein